MDMYFDCMYTSQLSKVNTYCVSMKFIQFPQTVNEVSSEKLDAYNVYIHTQPLISCENHRVCHTNIVYGIQVDRKNTTTHRLETKENYDLGPTSFCVIDDRKINS